jgi:hypothetical protein
MTPETESIWTVHPEVVTIAIESLVRAVIWCGAAISTLLGVIAVMARYMWRKHESRIDKNEALQEQRWQEVTRTLTEMSQTWGMFKDLAEHRITAQETKCAEREKHCPANPLRRSTDSPGCLI